MVDAATASEPAGAADHGCGDGVEQHVPPPVPMDPVPIDTANGRER